MLSENPINNQLFRTRNEISGEICGRRDTLITDRRPGKFRADFNRPVCLNLAIILCVVPMRAAVIITLRGQACGQQSKVWLNRLLKTAVFMVVKKRRMNCDFNQSN